jgi:hypothetical protein
LQLLGDKRLRQDLAEFVSSLPHLRKVHSTLNWQSTFEHIFLTQDFDWTPLKMVLINSIPDRGKKLTISLLIDVLGEKTEEGLRLELIAHELFLNHKLKLDHFLRETFRSLEFKSD